MSSFKFTSKIVPVSVLALATSPAFAVLDLTTPLASLADGVTAIATLGGAVLALVIGMKVWRRLRGAA